MTPPNWEPLSTQVVKSVVAASHQIQTVPSGARAVLLTANVDMTVGISTGDCVSTGKGIYLNAGEHWPALVMPKSTASFYIHGQGTTGKATFVFLTHRSIEP